MADFPKRFLNGFALLVTAGVIGLIALGGLVTSHGAGMAVPDWPNSFGYNMFLFPVSRWVDGIFFEHTHRLVASLVGLLTIGLFVLTLFIEDRKWVKWLAGIALVSVIIQGVLGGLRVTQANALLGLFHGCLAQAFLALVAVIALVTTKFWRGLKSDSPGLSRLRFWTIFVTGMIFLQLILGASMRHAHAALSIPDFPTVYGGFVPPMSPAAIAKINEIRATLTPPLAPTSAHLIGLQYLHRIWAVLIVTAILMVSISFVRRRDLPVQVRAGAIAWILLVVMQFCLGMWTIWSNKAADVATAHQVCGALTLTVGVLLSLLVSMLIDSSPRSRLSPRIDSSEVLRT
jgi:heme a synthase